ncbi:MAG: IPT/TIG domain-containing protein [Cyclobacteriaceae bacterium]|nr:IPT/TIG domain-containing protein [Cyclobacteriaceae bacterium]
MVLLLPTSICFAQEAPLLDWAKNIGATLYNGGNGIATDASGNVYTTGNFFGTQDFDPGPGVFNMSVTGSDDGIFISKLNSNGDFIWAKSIKNVYNTADAIGVDASGNVIIAGFFDKGDVMDFDPGSGTFNLSAVGYDMFVLKLTTDGDFIWAKQIKGATTAAHAFPESIALDASGNIYTTGYFQTTIDFDPGAATFNITAGEFRDIFISKLDSDGNFVWAKAMLGAGTYGACDDKGRSIALDASGNVYTSGFLRGTADFDPGAGTFNLTPASGGGFFISKLDNNGNFIWAKTFGGAASGVADVGDMALDASANIYMTGGVYGTSDFDPGAGTFNLASAGSSDIFISKLDMNGDFVWARLFGAGSGDYATTLDTDGAGNIYTAGNFNGTIDFDPGAGTFNLAGGFDYFLQKLDTDGNFVWAYSMNSGFEMSIKVQLPNLYITGQMQAGVSADLDPGPCTQNSNPGAVFTKKLRLGTAIPAPTISSFTPAVGPIGSTVTITGTNFSATPSENVVRFFNNRTATVTASTTTSITATVPASTVTGVISVTTNCLTATSATNFTIGATPPPTITSFTPASGPIGTTVTITGTNFNTAPTNNIVFFGATQAIVSVATATQLTVTVPVGATYQPINHSKCCWLNSFLCNAFYRYVFRWRNY